MKLEEDCFFISPELVPCLFKWAWGIETILQGQLNSSPNIILKAVKNLGSNLETEYPLVFRIWQVVSESLESLVENET